MNSGSIYDKDELKRVKQYIDQQTLIFSNSEKDTNLKQWLIIGGIATVFSVAFLLAFKKIYK